jgi:hypothetical protein
MTCKTTTIHEDFPNYCQKYFSSQTKGCRFLQIGGKIGEVDFYRHTTPTVSRPLLFFYTGGKFGLCTKPEGSLLGDNNLLLQTILQKETPFAIALVYTKSVMDLITILLTVAAWACL